MRCPRVSVCQHSKSASHENAVKICCIRSEAEVALGLVSAMLRGPGVIAGETIAEIVAASRPVRILPAKDLLAGWLAADSPYCEHANLG